MAQDFQQNLIGATAFVVWKHKGKILLTLMLVVSITFVGVSLVPPTFEAGAKILVREGREVVALTPEESREGVFRTKEEVINSEVAVLRSRYLYTRVIERLGVDVFKTRQVPPTTTFQHIRATIGRGVAWTVENLRSLLVRAGLATKLSPQDEAIAAVERGLAIGSVRKADVIELRFQSRTQESAVKVLDTLIALYLQRHNEMRQTAGSYEFFRAEVDRLRSRLQDAEQALHGFRMRQGVVAIDEQKRLLLGHVADATSGLDRTRREIAETVAKVEQTRAEMKGARRYDDVAKEMERQVLADEARLASLRASADEQRKVLEGYRARVAELAAHEMQLVQLTRDVVNAHADFEVYRKGFEERRIERQMDRERIVRVSIVEPASAPATPVHPHKLLSMVMAVPLGLVFGLVVALVADRVDTTFWRAADLERTVGVPVLGTLPEIPRSRR